MDLLCAKEFNLDQMVDYPSILIIAKRGCGKSVLIDNILQSLKKKYTSDINIVSPSEEMNPFYGPKYPDATIKYSIEENFLKEILVGSIKDIEEKSNKNKVLILDDCIGGLKRWQKNETVKEILMNGRHYKIPYVLTLQSPIQLNRHVDQDLLLNFDYIFLLREESTVNKKKLWKDYANMFPSFSTFEKFFDVCTKNYHAMVIDNRKLSDDIEEKVFWFKAKLYGNDESVSNNVCDIPLNSNEYDSDCDITLNSSEYDSDSNIITETDNESSAPTNEDITKIFESSKETINCLNLNYHDDNYEFSLTTNDLYNRDAIKIFCDHILSLKNIKLEYMNLVNENLQLRSELKKK